MTPDQWRRVQELLPELEQLPESEHEKFLERHCADDSTLRDSLRDMLRVKSITRERFLVPPTLGDGEADEGTLEPGTTLGEFTILELLGRGGMGTVYLAHDERLNRDVALKLMSSVRSGSTRNVTRFALEAQAAAKLRHDHIVRVHSTGVIGGEHYIAMEYIDGKTLADELVDAENPASSSSIRPSANRFRLPRREDRMFTAEISRIVRDIARALHHAHEAGILHRDVSPRNVLIDRAGRAYLSDFGLARDERSEAITVAGGFAGTPHYMSPERCAPHRVTVDARTDVFSLGVVLYEALAGVRPFEGQTMASIIAAITSRDPVAVRKLNPRVHRDLESICAKALEKLPEHRFATAAEFADELDRFLAHEPPRIRRVGVISRLARRTWNDRAARTGLAVAFSAALLFIGNWHLTKRDDRATVVVRGPAVARSIAVLRFSPKTLQFELVSRLDRAPDSVNLGLGQYRFDVLSERSRVLHFEIDVSDVDHAYEVSFPNSVDETRASRMILVQGGEVTFTTYPTGSTARASVSSFYLDRHEVTIGDYRAYLAETGRPPPREWISDIVRDRTASILEGSSPDQEHIDALPIGGVSVEEARQYAQHFGLRLPTEAEMEWALRGPENRDVPWSRSPPKERTEVLERAVLFDGRRNDSIFEGYLKAVARADSWPQGASWCGALHIMGNVKEWTSTHPVISTSGPDATLDFNRVVDFGGAWNTAPALGTLESPTPAHAMKALADVDFATFSHGFRCAVSVPQSYLERSK